MGRGGTEAARSTRETTAEGASGIVSAKGETNMSRGTVGRPMEILLVEDSLVDARLTIHALKQGRFHHRLTLVRDGAEAMEFLRRDGKFARAPQPDLVLLDLRLPKKDGLEVLTDLKNDYELKNIPVVVLTASDADADLAECRRLGVENYISKPVNFEKFLVVVKQLRRFWHADVILPSME
jgi:two-component system, chemotaxis family, response regulator Rcp1